MSMGDKITDAHLHYYKLEKYSKKMKNVRVIQNIS
jgi:hypothetical protein